MTDHGLVVGGEVVPGTEWIRRESDSWFAHGRGTRARAPRIDLLVGHWTGGEAGTRSLDDDGPVVVRNMRARRRADGSPLNVGIHLVVGACAPDALYAPVWQTADPGLVATVHIGDAGVNARSIGVEVVSAGIPGPANVRLRSPVRVPLLGRMRTALSFYPGQLRSWFRLASMLAELENRAGIAIPRCVPAFGATRRFSRLEMKVYAGAMEHLHLPQTEKIDAGGMLIEELARHGWARV